MNTMNNQEGCLTMQEFFQRNKGKILLSSIFGFLFLLSFILLAVGNATNNSSSTIAGCVFFVLSIVYGICALIFKCYIEGQWNCNCCERGYTEI